MANDITFGAYAPQQAEDGKFARIDPTWLQTFGYAASTVCDTEGGQLSAQGRFAVFTYQVNPAQVSLSGVTVQIQEVLPDSIWVLTQQVSANTAYHLTAPTTPRNIEIKNTSTNKTVYFLISAASTVAASDIMNYGLPIEGYGFYSVQTAATSYWIAAGDDIASVRLYGHYKA